MFERGCAIFKVPNTMRNILLLSLFIFASCSTDNTDLEKLSNETANHIRYITITNGDSKYNLYLLGLSGLAPGETTKQITLNQDKFSLPFCWSDNTSKYDTLKVDLSGQPYEITRNIIIKK